MKQRRACAIQRSYGFQFAIELLKLAGCRDELVKGFGRLAEVDRAPPERHTCQRDEPGLAAMRQRSERCSRATIVATPDQKIACCQDAFRMETGVCMVMKDLAALVQQFIRFIEPA